jgi:hypothetical protein
MPTLTTTATSDTVVAPVAGPGATAADLADHTRLGRSTVNKALAKLEQTAWARWPWRTTVTAWMRSSWWS